jgi:hypothetical protein
MTIQFSGEAAVGEQSVDMCIDAIKVKCWSRNFSFDPIDRIGNLALA